MPGTALAEEDLENSNPVIMLHVHVHVHALCPTPQSPGVRRAPTLHFTDWETQAQREDGACSVSKPILSKGGSGPAVSWLCRVHPCGELWDQSLLRAPEGHDLVIISLEA